MFLTAKICWWKRQDKYKTFSDMSLPGIASGLEKKKKVAKNVQPHDLDMSAVTKLCICLCTNFSSL